MAFFRFYMFRLSPLCLSAEDYASLCSSFLPPLFPESFPDSSGPEPGLRPGPGRGAGGAGESQSLPETLPETSLRTSLCRHLSQNELSGQNHDENDLCSEDSDDEREALKTKPLPWFLLLSSSILPSVQSRPLPVSSGSRSGLYWSRL